MALGALIFSTIKAVTANITTSDHSPYRCMYSALGSSNTSNRHSESTLCRSLITAGESKQRPATTDPEYWQFRLGMMVRTE